MTSLSRHSTADVDQQLREFEFFVPKWSSHWDEWMEEYDRILSWWIRAPFDRKSTQQREERILLQAFCYTRTADAERIADFIGGAKAAPFFHLTTSSSGYGAVANLYLAKCYRHMAASCVRKKRMKDAKTIEYFSRALSSLTQLAGETVVKLSTPAYLVNAETDIPKQYLQLVEPLTATVAITGVSRPYRSIISTLLSLAALDEQNKREHMTAIQKELSAFKAKENEYAPAAKFSIYALDLQAQVVGGNAPYDKVVANASKLQRAISTSRHLSSEKQSEFRAIVAAIVFRCECFYGDYDGYKAAAQSFWEEVKSTGRTARQLMHRVKVDPVYRICLGDMFDDELKHYLDSRLAVDKSKEVSTSAQWKVMTLTDLSKRIGGDTRTVKKLLPELETLHIVECKSPRRFRVNVTELDAWTNARGR